MYCPRNQPDRLPTNIFVQRLLTAHPNPRNKPRMPSFLYTTPSPWSTPRYSLGWSDFACSSPCSCSLILIVSNECVTVTAPHAAMPPAMKDPIVVDMVKDLGMRRTRS